MRLLVALLMLMAFTGPAVAQGTSALTLSPNPVALGEVVVGEASTATLNLSNVGTSAATIDSVVGSGVVVTSSTCTTGALVEPGLQCQISVQWTPLAPGALDGAVTVTTDLGQVSAVVNGSAVPALTLSVKAHSKALRVRKPVTLISAVRTNGSVGTAKVWCTYLGKRLPQGFAKKACGLQTAGKGKKLTATAEPLCSEDVTLEAKFAGSLGAQSQTWRRTWRVFVQPVAGWRPSEPICATMGERFGEAGGA